MDLSSLVDLVSEIKIGGGTYALLSGVAVFVLSLLTLLLKFWHENRKLRSDVEFSKMHETQSSALIELLTTEKRTAETRLRRAETEFQSANAAIEDLEARRRSDATSIVRLERDRDDLTLRVQTFTMLVDRHRQETAELVEKVEEANTIARAFKLHNDGLRQELSLIGKHWPSYRSN